MTFTAQQGSLVSRSIPAIAKIVASKLGVKVFFDAGEVPFADKNGIHLPSSMSACGSQEKIDLLNGFLDHEAAHIRYSDFLAIRKCRSPFEKTLLNIVEDIRIEVAIGNVFPGCKKNLAKIAKILDGNSKPRKGDDPSNLICGFLSTNLRLNVLGHEIKGVDAYKDAVLPVLGSTLLAQVEKLAFEGSKASDTDGVYDKVREIVDLLKQKSEEDKSKSQDSSDSKESEEGESDGNSDKSSEGSEAGESDSDANAEKSDSDDSSSSSSDSEGDKSAEKPGSSSNGSEPAQSGSGEEDGKSSKPGSGKGPASAATEEADDPCDQEALKEALAGEGKDRFAEALAEAMKSLTAKNSYESVEEELIVNLKGRGDGKFQTKETDSGIRKVAGKFDLLLWSKSDNQPYAASSGRLVARRLTSVVTQRNIKICDRVDESDGLNTAIQVMFDVSGSMGGYAEGTNRFGATQTAAIIAGVCERYEGINCGIAAFDEYIFPIKEFNEKWTRVGNRITKIGGGGGTAMGAAHTFAITEMLARDENRKVIIIATDGYPGNFPALSASVTEAMKHGLETRFVLIGGGADVDSFKAEIPSATCISKASTADEIPAAILASLTGGLGL